MWTVKTYQSLDSETRMFQVLACESAGENCEKSYQRNSMFGRNLVLAFISEIRVIRR